MLVAGPEEQGMFKKRTLHSNTRLDRPEESLITHPVHRHVDWL